MSATPFRLPRHTTPTFAGYLDSRHVHWPRNQPGDSHARVHRSRSVLDPSRRYTCSSGGSGSSATISVSILPTVAEVLDAGQTLSISALASQDSSGDGCSFTLSGPGTITAAPGVFGATNQAITYAAPAIIAASTTATVTATSIKDTSKTASITLMLYPAVAFPTQTLPALHAGVAYTATLTATGGTGMLGFAVTSGALPSGLSLAKTGALTGTPTTTGTFTFQVQASDSGTTYPIAATQSFTVTVN